MELLFAGLYGLAIGGAAFPLARPTGKLGPVLLPAIGAAVAVGWAVAASWASRLDGFGWLAYDQGWIWTILVLITLGICVGLALVVPRHRAADDAELLDRLTRAGRAAS